MRHLEQQILGPVYALARIARDLVWDAQQPTLIGVRALAIRDDNVLLVRHRSGATPWVLPGGGVERHERLEEAARRECYEEAGVPARVERVLGVYEAFRGTLTNYITVFVCRVDAQPNPPRSLEIADARYFAFDALPPDLDAGSRRRIDEYHAGAAGISALW